MSQVGPDRETVLRAASGDGAAFRILVDQWRGRVVSFGYRMTGNAAAAEDMAQEVFLHLFQVLRKYDGDRPFAPWMRRVMTNVVLNRLRGRPQPRLSLDARPGGSPPPADARAPDPGEEASAAEEAALVRERVTALPAGWRAVVALRYSEGLSIEEIADALDIPANTVKTRLFRAREALREDLLRLHEGRKR